MKKMLNSMDFVVATSPNYYYTSPVLSNPYYCKNVKIIPLGINEVSGHKTNRGVLKKLGIKENEKFFLFVGVFRYYKGIDILIKAASLINTKIVIAGSLPNHKTIPHYYKKLLLAYIYIFLCIHNKFILSDTCIIFTKWASDFLVNYDV